MTRRGVRLPLLVVLVALALLSGMSLSARAEPDAATGVGTPAATVDAGNPTEQASETEPAVTPTAPATQPTDAEPTDAVGPSEPGEGDSSTDDQEPQPEPTAPSTVDADQSTTQEAPASAPGQTPPAQADDGTTTDTGQVRAGAVPPSGTGGVLVVITDCEDPARVGQTDFFVFEDVFSSAAADSSECGGFLSAGSSHQYTLIGISVEYAETSDADQQRANFLFFEFLQPGTYQLRSDDTGVRSPVFTVRAGSSIYVEVYEYLAVLVSPTPFPFPTVDTPPVTVVPPDETPVIVDPPGIPTVITNPGQGGAVFGYVSVCRDESRPGDTEFRLLSSRGPDEEGSILPDGGDTNVPGSIGALCRLPDTGEVTLILTNVTTGEQRRVVMFEDGFIEFLRVPAGLYTLTEAASGDTSTVFVIRDGRVTEVDIYLLRAGEPPPPTGLPDGPKIDLTVTPDRTKDGTESPAATTSATDRAAARRTATQAATEAVGVGMTTSSATEAVGVQVTTLPATGQRREQVGSGSLPLLLAVSSLGLIGAAVLRRRRTT